jgi:hypothetical protein
MKRIKSIEEELSKKKNVELKKKKLNGPRTEKIIGFETLDDDDEVVLKNSNLNTELLFPKRNPTLIDLFLYYFDDQFLDLMIKTNTQIPECKLPSIYFISNDSRRRVAQELKRNDLLCFIATRFSIMSNPQSTFRKNWKIPHQDELFMGENKFQELLVHMQIRLNMVSELNERLGKYIKSGRYVSLDEKHKGTHKDHHLARWVHGKDPNWGHWITELVTIAPKTSLPILIKLMPLTSTDPKNVTIEPFNNYNLKDVHKEILDVIRKDTIIVEDAYYLDDKSRTLLRKHNIPYISAINPKRFEEIWVECSKHVEEKGDWIILYNKNTKEHAMMNWDPIGEKKHYVLTNAFENKKLGLKNIPENYNAISETYKLIFNGCDRYNTYLYNKYWPYQRKGWQSNFDDFFFTSIGMNIYVLYHELVQDDENLISWEEFCSLMSEAIFELIRNR